ncbi:hypothetical protein BDV96DRAFT_331440 [Lophiotrema nucula]|uniref:Uncharacterized protein n=1 Tax=Lophiotrema nucula TaxID=690887 RepID=A0A6A5YIS1_9PLEO|nr:hypothetical protein BDV96DRAFT_331440 [Lophiotrema nucula]
MAPLEGRARPLAHLSTPVLAAVSSAVGMIALGFIVVGILLVRARREHKRLLADLEERGVVIAQAHAQGSQDATTTRPRAVLRRNTMLPFNSKSGWGALPSVESINRPDPPSMPPHYAPPKPAGFVARSSRLSWPFPARRASEKAIHLRKIRVPILSTVIESPKPSPLVPVLSGSIRGDPPSHRKSESRPTSDQSLLQRHPIFRKNWQDGRTVEGPVVSPEPLRRSLTAKPIPKTEVRVRPSRSKSLAEIPLCASIEDVSQMTRPDMHARSASMCSQSSGNAPDTRLPPLPLEVARLKSVSRRRSLLSQSPSKVSVSSHESAGSSILATQPSPVIPRPNNVRIQSVNKRTWKPSLVVGPRPLRDTLVLHGKNRSSQGSIKSSAARFSSVTPTKQEARGENRSSTMTASSSLASMKVKTAESITLSKVSSPSCSPLTVRSLSTPKRHSGSQVSAYGSPPERRKASAVANDSFGNTGGPTRQLSQASTQASSTRSSNGNPFQWDPSPMSCGKPSALKGSPSARKGHRRQNCVRISLQPTYYGPPRSRDASPSGMNDIQEESPAGTSEKRNSIGFGFSNPRSLPRPPSTSVFNPEMKISAIRASLTPSSPTLSMANYDHGPIGSPLASNAAQDNEQQSAQGGIRLSNGSLFSIEAFPSPGHGTGVPQDLMSPPPTFALSRPSNEYHDQLCQDFLAPSSPFKLSVPNFPSDTDIPKSTDEYDPEHPHLVFQTLHSSPTGARPSLPFSAIPEEPLPTSTDLSGYERLRSEDSPPCSPKTIRPHAFLPVAENRIAFHLPIRQTNISEEPRIETIDPAILSNEAFSTLNSGFDNQNTSILSSPLNSRCSVPMPTSPRSARSMFEPLLEAAFPSSPPVQPPSPDCFSTQSGFDAPLLAVQSSPSSVYSGSPSASTSASPVPPCSPRPTHAQLPAPALNFSLMPTLSPSLRGPRGSPPRPLRSSIQKLRRMNSDAEKGGKAERRYLRLGREDSIALPGEESWLEDLDHEEEEESWDEAKGHMLVGDVLDDWEEEATMLDFQEKQQPVQSAETKPSTPPAKEKDELPPYSEKMVTNLLSKSSPNEKKDRSSSIWEDGERFWHSTPPYPPMSPNKPKNVFIPLSSSPVPPSPSNKKRDFEVAKDDQPVSPTARENYNAGERRKIGGNRYRKRSRAALGPGTPNVSNVKIMVQAPSEATPGSLYDQEGFLRV